MRVITFFTVSTCLDRLQRKNCINRRDSDGLCLKYLAQSKRRVKCTPPLDDLTGSVCCAGIPISNGRCNVCGDRV